MIVFSNLYCFRWFAISIFGATYTANLAAFLTINKYENPITNIEDLANQNKVKFGTARGQLATMLKYEQLAIYLLRTV